MATISVIILTYNEEQHIERCINSLKGIASEIFVIDSISNDKTVEIAEGLGANIYQNPFVNQAVQFNWALENCKITSDWVMRIDADEYIDNSNRINFKDYLSNLPNIVNGLLIKRKIVFMGQDLLHGGWFPKFNLRVFKYGKGICEDRWMDEHIVINEGLVQSTELVFVDENLNDLQWWIEKHNKYSNREVIDYYLNVSQNGDGVMPKLLGNDAERKRWLKAKYKSIPLFVRPLLNFIYRYFFRLGFLDGKSGLVWHILQGFWYRFLVDAKIYELKLKFNHDEKKIVDYIKEKYQIK